MARTRPSADQIVFRSEKTGTPINLDAWLEDLEQQVDGQALGVNPTFAALAARVAALEALVPNTAHAGRLTALEMLTPDTALTARVSALETPDPRIAQLTGLPTSYRHYIHADATGALTPVSPASKGLLTLMHGGVCVRNTTQVITGLTPTVVELNQIEQDFDSVFNTANHQYVAPADGLYLAWASSAWPATTPSPKLTFLIDGTADASHTGLPSLLLGVFMLQQNTTVQIEAEHGDAGVVALAQGAVVLNIGRLI